MTTDTHNCAALAAQPSPAGQGAVPCATSASHALRVAYRHLDMVSMRVSHCKDAAIIESAMKDVDTFDLNAAISALAARQPGAQEPVDDDWHLRGYAYASKQATTCAGCGKHKHTPLRIDAMGGHVCLTCIDQKLGVLLGEFGYPPAPGIDLGVLQAVSDEYNEWIIFHAAGNGDFDDFLRQRGQRDAAPGVGS